MRRRHPALARFLAQPAAAAADVAAESLRKSRLFMDTCLSFFVRLAKARSLGVHEVGPVVHAKRPAHKVREAARPRLVRHQRGP